MSPEDLVSCDNWEIGCNGGFINFAWKYLTEHGAVSDECFPYTAGGGEAPQCLVDEKCSDDSVAYKKYKCKAGSVVEMTTPDQLRSEIYTNGPIETSFSVYEDFMNYKSGVY